MDFNSWIISTPIANRGLYNNDIPENSILAISKAIKSGYGLCLDCRALADNTIVIFKDESLGRMTGTDGFISHCTLADIEGLKLGKTDEHIPTLSEVLKLVDGQVPIILNIKNLDKVSFEKYIWKTIKDYKGECAVASVNPYSLEWFKLNAPKVKRGQISRYFKRSDFKNNELSFFERSKFKRLKYNKSVSEPNFIIYNCDNLPNRFVNKYKDLPILADNVKSASQLERAKKYSYNIVFEGIEL